MDGVTGKRFLVLLFLGFLALSVAGCAEFGKAPSWMPFQEKPDDDLAGIPSPYERIEKLRKLGQKAAWASAEQRQQVSRELAQSYAAEADPTIRAETVRTLGEFPGAAADEALRTALSDPDPDVRVVACETWGQRGDATAAELLGGILSGDVDQDVRLAAARALGRCKDPAAVATLGAALEDKDPAMQYRAVLSLREVTGENFDNDVNRWRQYVKNGSAEPAESISLADRVRAMF